MVAREHVRATVESPVPRRTAAILLLAAVGSLCACGLFSGGDDEPEGTTPGAADVSAPMALPTALAQLPALEKGLTWYVSPFAAEGAVSVWVKAAGDTAIDIAAPSTIPGYHWPWANEGAARVITTDAAGTPKEVSQESLREAKPTSVTAKKGTPFVAAFRVPWEGGWRERWPAVMGTQGSDAGHLSAPTFALVRPANPGTRQRVYLVGPALSPLPQVLSTAASCGRGCVEASGFAELLDTPISFSKSTLLVRAGEKVDFVFGLVSPDSRTKADALLSRTGLPGFADLLWTRLSEAWGAIAPRFVVHVSLRRGCSYQGLEHALATALAMGMDCPDTLDRDFTLLVAHEMIHAWNVKQIFPREHARLPLRAFDAERTRQLYFYEGFTEGLARLVVSAWGEERVPLTARLGKWNETLAVIQSLRAGEGGYEARSMASVAQGYALGTWLALRAGIEARKVASDVPSAHARVLAILGLLGGKGAPGGFAIGTPWFRTLAFGTFEATIDAAKNARGYTKTEIAEAFRGALALPADHALVSEVFLSGDPFAGGTVVKPAIREAAAVAGLVVREEAGLLRVEAPPENAPSAGVSSYPF